MSEASIIELEQGRLPRHVLAGRITNYADALAIHPAELFGGRPPAAPPLSPADDVRLLGAVLRGLEGSAPAEAVAEALGWTLPRLRDVTKDLDTALAAVGMTVHTAAGDLALTSRHSDRPEPAVVATIAACQRLRRGLDLHRVKLLVDIASGGFKPNSYSNKALTAHLRALTAGGLTVEDPEGATVTPRLSDDVRYNLLLPATA